MSANYKTGVKEQRFILLSIVLLILTHSCSHLFGGAGTGNDIGGNSLTRKGLLVIYLTSISFAALNWKCYFAAIRRTWLLWILVAWGILSISWASLPELTFRRSIALMLTTVYGVYIADRINLTEMLYLLAKVFAILIAINLFVILIFPDYGIHQSIHFGAWRGFFSHKNIFGLMMLVASLIYLTLAMQGDHLRKVYWLGFIISVVLIMKSDSKTSILALLITCGCTPFLRAIRWPGLLSKAFYISGFLLTALSSYTIAINIERIMLLFGRDATFTGRTDIWRDGLAMIRQQPWIGYGFGSEWIYEPWGINPSWYFNIDESLKLDHLHNGYLELIAQLGGVGASLYGILFIFLLIRAVLLVERSKEMVEYWPLYYLIFFFIYNFFEPQILRQNSFIWIMFVMLFVWLTSPLPEKKHKDIHQF